ncbi:MULTISPECIES: hypothetical protein [Pedobacter]|uniref:Uncharacterized protein n=1 Tax=Pedobacter zeae TaxID=1737356 RepID=A0A7W6P6F7_9SPHI|nr:hypothetical protein [Pedobacter zeae]MBB4109102.1 hypothetical protein [Pedobacter zeae]GGH10286.1 hypothetical protein GCM10007422_28850 [Pedobacter zeae]
MKNILFAIATLFTLTLVSCRKEPVTVFPDYDKNWLAMEDNPNDPTIHANFQFYKETGIPVFVNDTIGSQTRVDVFGKTYTYYEVLSLSYSLGGLQSGPPPMVQSFTYCNKADVPTALAFLRAEIMPIIAGKIHVPSILLVENMSTNAFGTYAYKGLNTVAVAQISKIQAMSQTTKADYKAAILRAILTNTVLDNKYADILDKFYAVSRKFVSGRDAYGLNSFYLTSTYIVGLPAGTPFTFQAIGFLGPDARITSSSPISTWLDVCMYIEAASVNTDAQFKQKYAAYPNILTKYGYIRQILTDIGIK